MTELEASGLGEHPPSYMIFVVVFLFFLTGLLGFLICHLLKKKGYRCRAGDMEDDDEEEEEKLGGNVDDEDENQDTVEQILKCIIENEANMEAFNEMIGNHNVCVRHDPRLRKESIGGIPPHLHTVHSGTDHNTCHLCAQVKSKKGRRHSRTPRFKQRPGEQTVFSVGRFRVIHTDKKLQGAPNPLVGSGDQLNQSQDSEERKEGGYNLRNMFKDVRPPSENTNGVAPAVGKRRKSLTIFGLRRGSDPVPAKAGEGTERETGGVRFAIQQQPVVMEELSLGENTEVISSKSGIKPITEPSKNLIPASPKREAKTSGPEGAPLTCDLRSAPKDGSQQGRSPELGIKLGIKPPAGSSPNSLPVFPPASSGQIIKTAERPTDLKNKVFEYEDGYDPGPVQTSTPIAPMYESLIPTNEPQSYPSNEYPVTQTPPDRSSSPDNDQGFGANLALISLGSSPPSSHPIQSQSSVSSLKTPTSPLAITPSPKLSSRNTPLEATKTGFSPLLTPSPKLPSGRAPSFGISASPLQVRTPSPGFASGLPLETSPISPRTPSSPADQKQFSERSPHLTLKSGSVTSMTKGDTHSSPLPMREEEQEGASIPRREEKTEVKRAGILKKAKLSQVEGYQLYEDRPTNLLLSPSSPVSLSSPTEGRTSSVTVVKASPDSKREFSVVTMVENEDSSTLTKEQGRETSELGDKSGTTSAVDKEREVVAPGVGEAERQGGESSGAKVRPTVSQDRDDMVEMEDIRDCKVTQEEEVESREKKALSASEQN